MPSPLAQRLLFLCRHHPSFSSEHSFTFRRRLESWGCSDPVLLLHSIRSILGALITHRLASARRIRTFHITSRWAFLFILFLPSTYTALHTFVGTFKFIVYFHPHSTSLSLFRAAVLNMPRVLCHRASDVLFSWFSVDASMTPLNICCPKYQSAH